MLKEKNIWVKMNCMVADNPRPDYEVINLCKLNPLYTEDNYFFVNEHEFADKSINNVFIYNEDNGIKCLLILGDNGSGKSHLIQKTIDKVEYHQYPPKIIYVTCEQFFNQYLNTLKNNSLIDFRNTFRSTDILIIEDIEFLLKKRKFQEELLNTVKDLHSNGAKIIFTSSLPLDKILLRKDLLSVLDSFCIIDIQPFSEEAKLDIFNKMFENSGTDIDEEAFAFIADQVKNYNVSKLKSIINKIKTYSSLMKEDISLSTVQKLIKAYNL